MFIYNIIVLVIFFLFFSCAFGNQICDSHDESNLYPKNTDTRDDLTKLERGGINLSIKLQQLDGPARR
jgi:hypothetical protein